MGGVSFFVIFVLSNIMDMSIQNKRKIINDPVFGFIHIPSGLLYDLIQHPYFQRLNRIKQLGLSYLVYPGAQHTRLQHSIGAMYLTVEAVKHLQFQGNEITDAEAEGVYAAVLLHDIGHAPFSHIMEHAFAEGMSHEEITMLMMRKINAEMDGKLDLALKIFENKYPKRFLHTLVSGQLDMDRMDYLRRDSFYTGVSEGTIGSARIIKMLDVADDKIVLEAKGIYSIEQFLIARRLMYWQVYFHKTSVAAERMLINIVRRAKELAGQGVELFASPALRYFLYNKVTKHDFLTKEETLANYALLDDSDLLCAIKVWMSHDDKVLSMLCDMFTNRKLFKIKESDVPFDDDVVSEQIARYMNRLGISEHEAAYFTYRGSFASDTYTKGEDNINILYRDGSTKDISEASDMLNISVLSKQVRKHYFCYMKDEE